MKTFFVLLAFAVFGVTICEKRIRRQIWGPPPESFWPGNSPPDFNNDFDPPPPWNGPQTFDGPIRNQNEFGRDDVFFNGIDRNQNDRRRNQNQGNNQNDRWNQNQNNQGNNQIDQWNQNQNSQGSNQNDRWNQNQNNQGSNQNDRWNQNQNNLGSSQNQNDRRKQNQNQNQNNQGSSQNQNQNNQGSSQNQNQNNQGSSQNQNQNRRTTPENLGPITTPPTTLHHAPQGCTCPVTQQFNPVCGTDGNTYKNSGLLNCYKRCGTRVSQKRLGAC